MPQSAIHAAIMRASLDAIILIDEAGRVVEVNAAAEAMFGYRAAEAVGRELAELIIPAALRERHRQGLAHYLATGSARALGRRLRLSGQRKGGAEFPVELAIAELADASGQRLFAGFMRDLTDVQRDDTLRAGQQRTLEMVAAGAPLAETLHAIVVTIENDDADVLASILLLDADGRRVRHGAAARLPAAFCAAVDGEPIGPSAGSCGTALYRGEPVVVQDIRTDPLWKDYAPLAAAHGLRACWSTPIFDSARRALGTFALYARDPGPPKQRHLQLIEMATQIAAIAIVKARDDGDRVRLLGELRERETLFRSVFENAAVGMTLTDMDGRLIRSNAALERMLGYTAGELAGRPFAEVTHPDDVESNLRLYRDLAAGRIGHFQMQKRYLRKDDTVAWVQLTVSKVPAGSGDARYTIGMMEDITERKRHEDDLQRFRAAMDASGDAILLVDRASMRYIDFNQTLCDLVGYARSELLGMTPMDVFSADRTTLERDYDAIIADNEAAASKTEGHYRRKDGTLVPIETRRRALRTKDGWIIVGTARDISERKRAEQRIEYLATHDGLTELPNRTLIHDRIALAIARARRDGRHVALLYIDLDRFKVINDGFGHPFGDAVLKAVSGRLRALLRESDSLARHGGDEFLALLADLPKAADAYVVAQKLMETFEQPYLVEGREVHVTGSIGVSVFPQDGLTADALIANADVAMYRAKEKGRNTYQFFTREMSDETQRRVDLETGLRGAVAAGQLQLAYQPKVSLETGRITGCEALLRWTHPELGAVPPARFIPIAEDSGLIVPIGDWVLRTACEQNRAWQDAGLPPVTVSVNVSARQFLQQDVVAWVLNTLRQTGLAPEHLELELTESLIARDVDKVVQVVRELKSAGVRLSIDDFGTGYSSLSQLKRFRVDILKIDQSFVRHLLTEPDDAAICQAVISLARSLKLTVVAEGVETVEHCKFLHLFRCDEIQGYYFSRPVPAPAMEAMLRAGKRLSMA